MSFLDIIWFIFITFAFVAYLMVMFAIIGDLFRDEKASGWAKAAWIIFLILLPLLTSLVYLIARGSSMAERQAAAVKSAHEHNAAYIRDVAGSASPVDEIAKAKTLLDSGTISAQEFDAIKTRALATAS